MSAVNNLVNNVPQPKRWESIHQRFTDYSPETHRVIPTEADLVYVKVWWDYGQRSSKMAPDSPRYVRYKPGLSYLGKLCVLAWQAGHGRQPWQRVAEWIAENSKV